MEEAACEDLERSQVEYEVQFVKLLALTALSNEETQRICRTLLPLAEVVKNAFDGSAPTMVRAPYWTFLRVRALFRKYLSYHVNDFDKSMCTSNVVGLSCQTKRNSIFRPFSEILAICCLN